MSEIELTELQETIELARANMIDSGETIIATLGSFSEKELLTWAMANGSSEHDARKLATTIHEFLTSSAKTLRSASEAMELLSKIMKSIETEKETKDE